MAARAKVVEIIKTMAETNAEEWGKIEFEETKIGRLDHKIEKLKIIKLVPGVEWLRPDADAAAITASRWRNTRRSASSARSRPRRIPFRR